jgi:GntR family transcriptional repressor for pyruvate dehydrogenase complex
VSRRPQPPRVGELVADSLRAEILSGALSVLPRLEDLTDQFSVGPPAVREAMRILETEGLITVRRGNAGGAEVHLPAADRVAYLMSLVLQSKSTELCDVGAALCQLEPLCAAMCAARPDRGQTVVPALRAAVAEQADAIGDGRRTREIIDRFHRAIVTGCGNETLVLIVTALQVVFASSSSAVYDREEFDEPEIAKWEASLRDHERLAAAIADGDAAVAALALRHLEATHAYMSSVDARAMISAAATAASR